MRPRTRHDAAVCSARILPDSQSSRSAGGSPWHTHTAIPTSPQTGSGTPSTATLGNGGVHQQLFLNLAWVDVRPARNIHVRSAACQVDEALGIHMPQITSQEPAIAKGLGIGVGIVEIACKHGGANDEQSRPSLPPPPSRPSASWTLHLHPCAGKAAGADAHGRVVPVVMRGRQHGDVARHLAQPEILHQHRPQLVQRADLVGAIHGRACIDDIAQRGMVMRVHRRVFDQQFHDGRDGEHVGHPPSLPPAPKVRPGQTSRPWAGWFSPHALLGSVDARPRHATRAPPQARHPLARSRASGRTGGW